MVPNKPGLGDTEEREAGSPVNDAAQSNLSADVTVSNTATNDTQVDNAAVPSADDATLPQVVDVTLPDADHDMAPDAGTTDDHPVSAQPGKSGLRRGDVIEGTITSTSPTAILVDLGNDRVGKIPTNELERLSRRTLEEMQVGQRLTVFVVNEHDHNGDILLSVNRAAEEIDWQRAEQYRQSQELYETRVAGYNKGGLIVRFGRLRGFVPQSQMSADRRRAISGDTPEARWGAMVNEPILVKVMEVDRARNRLILSERTAARETREKRKENLISQLTVGEIRTGRVVSLEDFGAFVDIGGAEGLVHLTEISWKHVTHPKDALKVGQEVKVEVISIDRENKRIGLSMKRQEPDPWDLVATTYVIGQLVKGTITKLTKFGAFAKLTDLPEIEGLIHISELSDKRVNHPREVVNEGEELTLRVVKMDVKNRRLGLSLKRVNSAEYLDLDWSADTGDSEG
jgi:small subunit ribosomal protein S1